MRPGPLPPPRRLRPLSWGAAMALALVLIAPLPAHAQDRAPAPPSSAIPGDTAEDARAVAFEANAVSYDSDTDVVTAEGDVVLRSEGQSVRADAVTWNRTSGQIIATGNIRFVDTDGN